MAVLDNIRELAKKAASSFTDAEAQQQDERQALMEARKAEAAARRESAIRQQGASMATERQSVLPPEPEPEQAPPPIAIPAGDGPMDFPPESEQTVGMHEAGLPKKIENTNADPRRLGTDVAARIRAKQAAEKEASLAGQKANTNKAIQMADAGLSGDTNIVGSMRHGDSLGFSAHGADHGDVELETFAPADPDDMTKGRRRFWTASDAQPSVDKLTDEVTLEPTAMPEESPAARQDAADAMQEQDEYSAKAKAQTDKNYGDALQPAYQNFLQNLIKTNQMEMYRYYTGTDEVKSEADETDPLVGGGLAAGMQRFTEDVLETDQNTNAEQMDALQDASKANDPRFANKVPDFNENTGNRPGAGRQATNAARGTREFESRLDQRNIPEKLRDPDKNMVPTNMFDPETGEPGIAGKSPFMIGEGMPEREGASAIYGPPGTNYKRRGMEMGDQHGPNGSGDGDANYMMSLMTEENWNGLRDQDRRDLVMNLAWRLGYLGGIKKLPEEDQYYAAKRAVFSHIFQTGNGAQKIWANNEAELGQNSNLIDPNKKPMLENEWDDNRGQWVLTPSQDVRDRARMRSATAFASRGMKGHSQIDQYMNPDGTVNEEATGSKMLEVINRERVNMGEEPAASFEELTENEKLAYTQGMRLLGDMDRHAKVKQNNMDQGRGQMMMGHSGNSVQWRHLGGYNRELEGAETLEEKAAIARKYNNRQDMTRFDQGAHMQAERDAATEAAALEKSRQDEMIKINREESELNRKNDLEKTRIANQPDPDVPYYDRLGAAESPQEAEIINRGELRNQLESIADENGYFSYEDVMGNNKIISVLNNMYLQPDMGRSWFEYFRGENEEELNFESYNMHMNNYVSRVISDLGFNTPAHDQDRKQMKEFLMKNYAEKFRETNPSLAKKILSMGAAQAGGATSEGTAQETQEQETQEPTTNGKPVEGPQEDSLPDIPPGNAPGTRARRRRKPVTGASIQIRSPFEANPNYTPNR